MTRCARCGAPIEDAPAGGGHEGTSSGPADGLWHPSGIQTAAGFQVLVVLSAVLLVAQALLPFLESRFLSDESLDLLSAHGYRALLVMPASVSWLWNLLWLAVCVGLHQFSASARSVFALFMAANVGLVPFLGITVASPLMSFLGCLGWMADAAILVLAYGTPLRRQFR